MKLHLLVLGLALTATFAAELQYLWPTGGITDETPSLKYAYPNEVYILRTMEPHGGVVHYEVRFYAPELLNNSIPAGMWRIAIVVCYERGTQLLSTQIESSGVSHIPPSNEKFRSIRFSVHESLERTTAVNIGRFIGKRTHSTKYRLPLKSIGHNKAH